MWQARLITAAHFLWQAVLLAGMILMLAWVMAQVL
jgi:hypothetical protein